MNAKKAMSLYKHLLTNTHQPLPLMYHWTPKQQGTVSLLYGDKYPLDSSSTVIRHTEEPSLGFWGLEGHHPHRPNQLTTHFFLAYILLNQWMVLLLLLNLRAEWPGYYPFITTTTTHAINFWKASYLPDSGGGVGIGDRMKRKVLLPGYSSSALRSNDDDTIHHHLCPPPLC